MQNNWQLFIEISQFLMWKIV